VGGGAIGAGALGLSRRWWQLHHIVKIEPHGIFEVLQRDRARGAMGMNAWEFRTPRVIFFAVGFDAECNHAAILRGAAGVVHSLFHCVI
jgi:hypothetical protein